jgi:hypothetical protein
LGGDAIQVNASNVITAAAFTGYTGYTGPGTAAIYGTNGYGLVSPDTPVASPNVANDEFTEGALDTAGTRFSSATAWTWVNQGSASATLSNGSLTMACAGSSADNWAMIVQTAPSPAYTFVAKLALNAPPTAAEYPSIAMVLRKSSTGQFMTHCVAFRNPTTGAYNSQQIIGLNYTNPTTYGGSGAYSAITAIPQLPWIYMSIRNDGGGNFIMSWSADGIAFYQVASVSTTSFFTSTTADQIGLALDPYTAGGRTTTLVCDWFRRTA